MNTSEQILEIIKSKPYMTPAELSRILQISRVTIHTHLRRLLEKNLIVKRGRSPKTYYVLSDIHTISNNKSGFTEEINKLLDDQFTYFTPAGTEMRGSSGFLVWCNERKHNPIDYAEKFQGVVEQYSGSISELDATSKIESSFESNDRFLDELYYLYPYSVPIFGKLRIATELFIGKQSQDKGILKRLFNEIKPKIIEFIEKHKPNAIAYIPPTVPRRVQVMEVMEYMFALSLPHIKLIKIPTPIQQKSLRTISDRITNAEQTLFIQSDTGFYNTILIIDDFTGSGASMNILAKKLKEKHITNRVIGLAITGSMKGFDVIKDI